MHVAEPTSQYGVGGAHSPSPAQGFGGLLVPRPVVVVKSGRHAQGAKAAQTHTGALAGADAVYDAAFRRAGLLREWIEEADSDDFRRTR